MTTKTDRSKSILAEEFVWDTADLTEVHQYVTQPIISRLKSVGASEVLDIGCGNGALSAKVASEGFSVTGTEHSKSGIEIAKNKFPNVNFQQYDINDPLPAEYSNKFDAVIAVEVIEHLLLPRKLIENSLAALKKGGILIITTPYHGYAKNLALALTNKFDDHWHPLRDFGHVKFFSPHTLTSLLNEYSLGEISVDRVGRIPAFARSMIVYGKKKG